MQKLLAFALVVGALIIGAALAYHGRQLAQLSAQLKVTQQQVALLDTNLQSFSRELPDLIGDAGRSAGRQAVHGMAEEALQLPLDLLKSNPVKRASQGLRRTLSNVSTEAGGTNWSVPLVHFDIPQPTIINIGVVSDLQDLPAWLWPPLTNRPASASSPNPATARASEQAPPTKSQ